MVVECKIYIVEDSVEAYDMHDTILTWKRCPSVYEGGKPYFYVAFCIRGNIRDKYTVVWNRLEESWVVTKNDVHVTNVVSPRQGMKYAENIAQATPIITQNNT